MKIHSIESILASTQSGENKEQEREKRLEEAKKEDNKNVEWVHFRNETGRNRDEELEKAEVAKEVARKLGGAATSAFKIILDEEMEKIANKK